MIKCFNAICSILYIQICLETLHWHNHHLCCGQVKKNTAFHSLITYLLLLLVITTIVLSPSLFWKFLLSLLSSVLHKLLLLLNYNVFHYCVYSTPQKYILIVKVFVIIVIIVSLFLLLLLVVRSCSIHKLLHFNLVYTKLQPILTILGDC